MKEHAAHITGIEIMNDEILLGHGSGGKLTHDLIDKVFIKYFNNPFLIKKNDSAVLKIDNSRIAFTTDSYVVNPIFFPGGDIGKLAVCGTVNDLAVAGAKPLYLSASFIIEEGLSLNILEKIACSMADESKKAGVIIVAGDTKVVNKGDCDNIFINTSGIGVIQDEYNNQNNIQAGDKIIINGFIGDHETAILSERNNIKLKDKIISDCASLNNLIKKAMNASNKIKFMQDVTRGGLATILSEIALKNSNIGLEIEEKEIPIRENVKGLCEIFGFDPLYFANEGKVLMIVDKNDADAIIKAWKNDPLGKNAKVIGEVVQEHKGKALLKTMVGGSRILDMLSGLQLPRIC